uniref:ATP-dependent DNA helicase n=1 Tax=Tanacetum cinerariifolium TaxID=118510 RepID=A0A6L2LK61_TANCI|nr:hypothetical protein [Tanacetum cinerariifolium]
MKEYYAYIIQHQPNQGTTLLQGGRLFQQYLVDSFMTVEEQRLKGTRNNQDTLRVDLYHNLCDAVTQGDMSATGLRERIVQKFYRQPTIHDAEISRCNGSMSSIWKSRPVHHKSPDWPEIGTQVFKMKLTELMDDLTKRHVFGDCYAVVYVIEFQKQGLPHAHILLWLEERFNKDTKYAACTTEGKCSKHYPKAFLEETMIDEDGYPIYRRRNNKVTAKKGKFTYNNKHVVPYNRADGASVQISQVDEIKNYLICQFIAPCEAIWRLFSFDIHHSYPMIMQLNYHLPNQNTVTLRDSEDLPTLLEKEGINITMLTDWFELYKRGPATKGYTYAEIPQHYNAIEHCKRSSIVWKLVTVNKQTYATFKAACFTYGLLNDDKEWSHAIVETKFWLIREALDFDVNKSRDEHEQLHSLLNPEQHLVYDKVIESMHSESGQFYFIRIASFLLPGDRTTHNRFAILLELVENNTCGIKQNTHLAELLQQLKLVIWDEAPMTRREDFLEDLFPKQISGNPTFSLHKEITLPEVTHEIHDSKGCSFLSEKLPDIDSFNDIRPHFDNNPLSGSTTYSSNSLLEEFTDELALITYPLDYDDNLQFDIESDLREIEFLLYQGKDSALKDSIDQTDLANFDAYFVDPTPEMFTDEHAPDYSFPPRFNDFFKDDDLPSPDNEDKVFNPGILIHEKLVKIITRVAQEKKLATSKASLVFEDFDPPFYEPIVFKNVPNSMRLLPFSSENEEKVFKPGIYTFEKLSSIPGNMKTLANGFYTQASSPLFNLGITYPNLIELTFILWPT